MVRVSVLIGEKIGVVEFESSADAEQLFEVTPSPARQAAGSDRLVGDCIPSGSTHQRAAARPAALMMSVVPAVAAPPGHRASFSAKRDDQFPSAPAAATTVTASGNRSGSQSECAHKRPQDRKHRGASRHQFDRPLNQCRIELAISSATSSLALCTSSPDARRSPPSSDRVSRRLYARATIARS